MVNMVSPLIIFALPFIVMNILLPQNNFLCLIVFTEMRFVSFSDTRRERRKNPKVMKELCLKNNSSIFVGTLLALQTNLIVFPCLLALLIRGGIETNPGPANKTKSLGTKNRKKCMYCKAFMSFSSSEDSYHVSCKPIDDEVDVSINGTPANELQQLPPSDHIEVSNPTTSCPSNLADCTSTQLDVHRERLSMIGPEWSLLLSGADATPDLYILSRCDDVFQPICTSICQELCTTVGLQFQVNINANSRTSALGVPTSRYSVPGDGNCLFSSLSAAISGSISDGIWLRQVVCHMMAAIPGIERYLMLPSGRQFASVEQYLQFTRMREDDTYGSSLEIGVFCFLTNTTVNVYSVDSSAWLRHTAPNISGTVTVNDRNIYLIHERHHYEPVTSTTITLPGPTILSSSNVNDATKDSPPVIDNYAKRQFAVRDDIFHMFSSDTDDDVPLAQYQKLLAGKKLPTKSDSGLTPPKKSTQFDFASAVFKKTKSKVKPTTSKRHIKIENLFNSTEICSDIPHIDKKPQLESIDRSSRYKLKQRKWNKQYYEKNKDAIKAHNLERSRKRLQIPENRMKNLESTRKRLQIPENRLKNLESTRKRRQIPENRLKNLESTRKRRQIPENRLKNLESTRKRLEIPDNRLKNLESAHKRLQIAKNRLTNLERSRKRLQTPFNRLANLQRSKRRLSLPENRPINLERSKRRNKSLRTCVRLIDTDCVSEAIPLPDGGDQVVCEESILPDTSHCQRQNVLKMVDDHINNVLPTPISAQKKEEIIVEVRELLSAKSLLERACLVCDLLFIRDEGKYHDIANLNKSFKRKLKDLLEASKVLPALHPRLIECYNIGPILLSSGFDLEAAQEFQGLLLSPRSFHSGNVFICHTCHSGITNSRLPKMAIANNNAIGTLPAHLEDCTEMEVKLSSFVVPKLSLQTVRGGGQTQVNSHSILFDSPVTAIAQTLPRLDATDIIRVITTTSIARCIPLHQSLRFAVVRIGKVRDLLKFFSEVRDDYKNFGAPHERSFSILRNSIQTDGIPSGVVEVAELENDDDIISNIGSGFASPVVNAGDQSRDFVYVNNTISADYTSLNTQVRSSSSAIPNDNRFFVQLGNLVSDLNPAILPIALPSFFPFARGACDEKRRVSISRSLLFKRFLRLSTKQFARSRTAVGLFFDMESRARALSVATLTLPKEIYANFTQVTVEQMKSAIAFNAEREKAIRSGQPVPSPPNAQQTGHASALLRQANFSAAAMLNTPEERLSFRKEVLSIQTIFGNPSLFLTINPADVQSPVLAMNGMSGLRFIKDLCDSQPSRNERFQAVAENPVAAAQWFHRVIHIVFRHVLGIDIDSGVCDEGGGVVGKVCALAGGIEQQARLSLHLHNLIWIVGVPDTTAKMERFLQDETFLSSLTILINSLITSSYSVSDSIVCSNCDADASNLSFIPSDQIKHADKPIIDGSPEEPTVLCICCNEKLAAGNLILSAASSLEPNLAALASNNPDLFLQNYASNTLNIESEDTRGADTLAQLLTCTHDYKHRPTCFQVKKVNGPVREVCRARFPRIDTEEDLITRKPGSSWLNPHNDVILRCLSCNNDCRFISKGSPALIYYTTSYPFKPQQTRAADDAILNAAFAKRVQSEQDKNTSTNVQTTDVSRGRGRVLSSLYVLTQSVSTGLPLAAYYLLNDSAYVASHRFIKIQIPQLLSEITGYDRFQSLAANGTFSRIVPQLTDYLCRGDSLSTFPYYLVVSLYEKVSSKLPEKLQNVPDDFLTVLLLTECGINSDQLPTNVSFRPNHPQCLTHKLKLRPRAFIVILHGRRLYNLEIMKSDSGEAVNDDDDNFHTLDEKRALVARFCLGLFKPWRLPEELLDWADSWFDAYQDFLSSSSPTKVLANRVLWNSQEYYIGKSDGRREQSERSITSAVANQATRDEDMESDDNVDQEDVISAALTLSASAALTHISAGNVHTSTFRPPVTVDEINLLACSLREAEWKRQCTAVFDDIDDFFDQTELPFVGDTDSSRERFVKLCDVFLSRGIPQLSGTTVESLPDMPSMASVIAAFTLNEEQAAAFTLLATYLISPDVPHSAPLGLNEMSSRACSFKDTVLKNIVAKNQLHLVIHGPAGTGKSRVIQSFKRFAELWKLSHAVLVTATTGAAAVLLGAQTYHSALRLNFARKKAVTSEVRSKFLQVRVLIIDEMSMLGTTQLQRIDNQLRSLRGKPSEPFGGLSVLLGDYLQLQPVKDTALYVPPRQSGRARQIVTPEFYRTTFTAAVCLQHNMRLTAEDNQIIQQLRQPPPSLDVVNRMNERCLDIPTDLPWFPVTTATNAVRQNIVDAHTVAAARSFRVFALPAHFKFRSKLTYAEQQRSLRVLKASYDHQLGFLTPVLYVYVGMHVMITENCDVPHGIVNGTTGTVVGFVWEEGNSDTDCTENTLLPDDPHSPTVYIPNKLPSFVFVKLNQPDSLRLRATIHLTDVPDDVWPVKVKSKDVARIQGGFRASAKMRQFPILCADSLTFHKLQGSTIDSCLCIDSLKGAGLQSAYTALTRIRRLDQLYLREPLLFNVARGWKLPIGYAEEQSRLQSISDRLVFALTSLRANSAI